MVSPPHPPFPPTARKRGDDSRGPTAAPLDTRTALPASCSVDTNAKRRRLYRYRVCHATCCDDWEGPLRATKGRRDVRRFAVSCRECWRRARANPERNERSVFPNKGLIPVIIPSRMSATELSELVVAVVPAAKDVAEMSLMFRGEVQTWLLMSGGVFCVDGCVCGHL